MSTEAAADWLARAGFGDERSIRVLRLGVGITLAAAVSFGIGWPLSFMAPVLATSLLASRTPCPYDLAAGAALVSVITIAGAIGLVVVAPLALYYPLVCAVVLSLLLFGIFRAGYRGTSPFVILFLLVAVLLIPMVAQESLVAAQEVTVGLIAGARQQLRSPGLPTRCFPTCPEPRSPPRPSRDRRPTRYGPEWRAALTTAVVYPVALLFYSLGLTDHLVVLVFIAILAQQPSLDGGPLGGRRTDPRQPGGRPGGNGVLRAAGRCAFVRLLARAHISDRAGARYEDLL